MPTSFNLSTFAKMLAPSLLAALASCGQDTATAPEAPVEAPSSIAFQELYDQGIDRFLGDFTPSSTQLMPNGTTRYAFSGNGGPLCYTGQPFSMFTRDGSSNDLLIFTQGGGVCGPRGCAAVETGLPLVPFGLLDPNNPRNPAATFDVGYIPYCDGCFMMGDAEVDSDGDGVVDRHFRGLQNLSASLDVIARRYPAPGRIVLAGNSAGGFAVHAALPLVRKLYPGVPIDMINDSGVGVFDPGGWNALTQYWNAGAFMPRSCPDCVGADGNLTGYHAWQLAQDPNVRLAYLTSTQDSVVALSLAGGGPALATQVVEAATELRSAFPTRFQALIANGTEHTFLISDFDHAIGGTTVREWVTAMLRRDATWVSRIEGN